MRKPPRTAIPVIRQLYEFLRARGITDRELRERLRKGTDTFSHWWSGYAAPNLLSFTEVAQVLDLDVRLVPRDTPSFEDAEFSPGDLVEKASGYRYPGTIVGVVRTRAGAIRYVVEATHPDFAGMLHVFSGEQLRKQDEQ